MFEEWDGGAEEEGSKWEEGEDEEGEGEEEEGGRDWGGKEEELEGGVLGTEYEKGRDGSRHWLVGKHYGNMKYGYGSVTKNSIFLWKY